MPDKEHVAVERMVIDELKRCRAENERLHADIETWGRIWNDAEILAARVEALRDGSAQT